MEKANGTSLSAAVSLGKEKGYVYIGCDSRGENAVFVLKGLADELETTPQKAYYDNQHHSKRGTLDERWKMIKDFEFTTV